MARRYSLKFAKKGPQIDDHFVDFIDGLFAELGISPAHAQAMADRYQAYVGQRMASEAASAQRELDGIKARLGNRFDESVAAGRKAALSMGLSSKTLDALQKHIGMAPVAELLSAVGQRIGSASPAPAQAPQQLGNPRPAPVPLGMPAQDAKAEIARLSRDKGWQDSLFDKKHSQHVENTDRWTALHAAAYPPDAAPAPAAESGAQ